MGCCSRCGSHSTITSTCGRRGCIPGVDSPLAGNPEIDFVVVREGTEGPYTGNGGAIRVGTPHEVATEVSLNTAFGVQRVVRDAFTRAAKRRKHLTLVHKTNVLTFAGSSGRAPSPRSATEFPDVEVAYQHIDAATIHMVTDPGRFDVIVTDNLFGDIITDLAAAVSGGIGLAASGNIDATRTNPSMFEPVHGSAPDIAGQGIADPTAAVMSVAMLLAHVGEDAAAARVDKAVEQHLATRGDESCPPARSAIGSRPCCELRWLAEPATPAGILIALRGAREGTSWNMPPDLTAISAASPGIYTLRGTLEEFEDPDLVATWSIREPDEH